MKTDLVSRSHLLTAALLPPGIFVVLLFVVAWLALGWRSDTASSLSRAHKAHLDAQATDKRIALLRSNKDAVDKMWNELSAGTIRVVSSSDTPAGGFTSTTSPSVNVDSLPTNRGAASAAGLGNGRPRELPEALSAFSEADFSIVPVGSTADHVFRRYGMGSDKIEFGRLLPLLAGVESAFPLALVEEALFTLPASAAVFTDAPHALECRLVVRLPIYDPAARARALKTAATPKSTKPVPAKLR